MLSLTRPNVFPPGGFAYTQAETGQIFKGNDQLKAQAKRVLAHRQGNHLPRATLIEAMEDIMAAVCVRHPALCTNVDKPQREKVDMGARSKIQGTETTANKAPASAPISETAPTPPRQVKKCGSCGGRKANP